MMSHPGLRCRNDNTLLSIEELKPIGDKIRKIIKCKVCKKDSKYGYCCKICGYCFCLKCGRSIADYIQTASGKLCSKGHKIEWMSKSPDGEEIYECSHCKEYFDYGFFYCNIDKIQICLKDIQAYN